MFHRVPREQLALAPNAHAQRAFPFRCQSFERVILQQLSVALQLPFRGDVSPYSRCEAAWFLKSPEATRYVLIVVPHLGHVLL